MPPPENTSVNKARYGFTLAEVLITLGIIGVVASLTMPSLIANHRKEVLKTELKKAYSELQQVNLSFINDEEMNMCEYDWMLVDSGLEVMAASKELSRKFIKYYQGNGEYIYNLGIDNIKPYPAGMHIHLILMTVLWQICGNEHFILNTEKQAEKNAR